MLRMMSSRLARLSLHGMRQWLVRFIVGALLGSLTHHLIGSFRKRQPSACPSLYSPQAEEVPSKELLFIGVMTSRTFLSTRATTVYRTWGKAQNGSLMFFLGQGEHVKEKNLPLQILNVTDNQYPPQRKAFAMLEFMHKKYGQRYEWFARVDDDVLVDVHRLRILLSSLNSSLPLYVGYPRSVEGAEAKRLGLPPRVPYCIGGPGIILSSVLLASIVDKLDTCLHKTASRHEDVELGRCILHTTGLACFKSEQVDREFENSLTGRSGEWIQQKKRLSKPYISLHPFKDLRYMDDTAAKTNVLRVIELQEKVRQLTAMVSCMDFYEQRSAEVTCKDGNCDRKETSGCYSEIQRAEDALSNRFHNISWFLIHQGTFHTSWKFNITKPASLGGVKEGLDTVLRHLSADVTAREAPNTVKEQKKDETGLLGTFYQRVIPAVGVEYIAFRRDASSHVRPYVIRQSFDDLELNQRTMSSTEIRPTVL